MEQTKKNNILSIILSVLIAVALWMYVGDENPDVSRVVRDIPVTFVGTEVLENRGLMIAEGMDQTISLTVSGRRNVVNALTAETVSVRVDVSSIQQVGEYTQAYTISPSSLVVTERYPLNISFTVVRRSEKTVPVRGVTTGSIAEGYQAGEFSFTPNTIKVSGESTVVEQIEYAQVTLDQQDLVETYSGDRPFKLITFSGEIVDLTKSHIETNLSLVRTTLPIGKLKEVELSVQLINGGGATAENVQYEISPASIVVSGASEDLDALKSISLGEIDLAKISTSDTLVLPIQLASELNNVSGVSEATVTILVQGLKTAVLEADQIELLNIPAGFHAKSVTQSRSIQIRGTEEAVAAVTAAQLRIVADLENAAVAVGTQTVPVKVYLDSDSGAGVVGEYNIVVSISK